MRRDRNEVKARPTNVAPDPDLYGDTGIIIELPHRKIVRLLWMIVGALLLLYVISQLGRFLLGDEFIQRHHLVQWLRQFNLDEENNISNWYESTALLFCSGLLGIIAIGKRRERDRFSLHWTGLAIIFLFLSMDESASLHEMTILPLKRLLHVGGFLSQAWVILGIGFLIAFGVVYLRFLMHLTPSERFRFTLSGAIFVTGAVVMEMIGGRYESLHGMNNVPYMVMAGAEETLEMTGIVLFISALLAYLGRYKPEFKLRISQAATATKTFTARSGPL
jgi:hypothetical protein